MPPKSLRRVLHTLSGAPYRKAVQLHTRQRVHSTENSAAVILRNYYFFGCGDELLLQQVLRQF